MSRTSSRKASGDSRNTVTIVLRDGTNTVNQTPARLNVLHRIIRYAADQKARHAYTVPKTSTNFRDTFHPCTWIESNSGCSSRIGPILGMSPARTAVLR